MTALAPLLVLALAAAPRAPLEGCAATGYDDGWYYDCGDLRAEQLDRVATREEGGKFAEGRLKSLMAALPRGARTRNERRTLGGADAAVLVADLPEKRAVALFTAIQLPAGPRIVQCVGESGRCGAVLEALAQASWRGANAAGSIRKDEPLALGRRSLQPPAGCEVKRELSATAIRCGKANWVLWTTGDERGVRNMAAKQASFYREKFRAGWRTSDAEVPCLAAGAKATCSRIVAENGTEAANVLWTVARIGDEHAFVSCFCKGKELTSPCSLVFDLGEEP